MSELKVRLQDEMKEALRGGHKVRLAALRLLSASVKNREVELRREVTDDEFLEVVAREVKRRKESIDAYRQGGRQDLVDRESEEQTVLEAYLPRQLSDDELLAVIEEVVAATGASSSSDLGKVMGPVMGRVKGRADGSRVNALVRRRLGG